MVCLATPTAEVDRRDADIARRHRMDEAIAFGKTWTDDRCGRKMRFMALQKVCRSAESSHHAGERFGRASVIELCLRLCAGLGVCRGELAEHQHFSRELQRNLMQACVACAAG